MIANSVISEILKIKEEVNADSGLSVSSTSTFFKLLFFSFVEARVEFDNRVITDQILMNFEIDSSPFVRYHL